MLTFLKSIATLKTVVTLKLYKTRNNFKIYSINKLQEYNYVLRIPIHYQIR